MRRRWGVADIQKQQATTTKFKAKSEAITKEQIEKLTEQMETFKTFLETFASKHREQIRDNPEFRRQFLLMCATVGVDPLQSTNNFWTKFSGVGVFYIELAVQVVEVCKATTPQNGGLITIEELLRRVKLSRKSIKHKKEDISIDDILRCIDKISVLGNGIKVFKFNKSYIIQSVPKELSLDHTEIVKLAQSKNGYIHKAMVMKELNWEENRFFRIINDMIMEGLVWLDKQSSEATTLYWFPGLFSPSQMR